MHALYLIVRHVVIDLLGRINEFGSVIIHSFTTKLVTRMVQSSAFKEFVPEEEPILAYLEMIKLFFPST